MKKAVVLLLAVIYITLTSGVAVNVHYCMGKIAGTTYGPEREHQCDRCGMEKRSGCCETEHKLVKADDDHLSAKTISAKAPVVAAIAPHQFISNTTLISTQANTIPRYHAPPDIHKIDLCVLNSVFRI